MFVANFSFASKKTRNRAVNSVASFCLAYFRRKFLAPCLCKSIVCDFLNKDDKKAGSATVNQVLPEKSKKPGLIRLLTTFCVFIGFSIKKTPELLSCLACILNCTLKFGIFSVTHLLSINYCQQQVNRHSISD